MKDHNNLLLSDTILNSYGDININQPSFGPQKNTNLSFLNKFQKNYVFLGKRAMFGSYMEQRSWRIEHELNVEKFKWAWLHAQNTFKALQLSFVWNNGLQVKQKDCKLNWHFIDLSKDLDLFTQEEALKRIKIDDMEKPYALEEGGLFRVYIIKHNVYSYTCLLSNHIAILDHHIFQLLKKHIEKSYESIEIEKNPSYVNSSVANQLISISHQTSKYANEIFLEYASKIERDCDLNGLMINSLCNKVKPLQFKINYMSDMTQIKGEDYKKLKEFTFKNHLTLHSVLQYVWHKIINVYSNNTKTVTGTILHGKTLSIKEINEYSGSSFNIMPLLIDHQILMSKGNTLIESIRHVDYEISRIGEFEGVDNNAYACMDSMLFYENNIETALSDYNCYLNLTGSPIILQIAEYDTRLDISIIFNGNVYNRDRIRDIAYTIESLLQKIIEDPHQNESELCFIPNTLLKKVLIDFNKTDERYLENITVHGLFERQVIKNPKNIAAIDDQTEITYEALEVLSNKLANHLIALGIKKGDLVGVSIHKSIDLIVALLGVLKAGGAYIPFATSYPVERLDAMLEDSNPSILIADHFIEDWLPKYKGDIVRIDFKNSLYHQQEGYNPNVCVNDDDLAYTIYTSGSTGEPKGVMIEHGRIVNTLQDINFQYSVTDQDKAIVISNISFDLSVYDMFGLLAAGGTIIFPDVKKESNASYLVNFMNNNSVTIWSSTPALMDWFINNIENEISDDYLKDIRLILLSGDWIPLNLPQNIYRKMPNTNLLVSGLGGATEVSIWSVHYPISKVDLEWRSIPYGKPLGNQAIYILDNNLKPIPVGAVGEMYIGGKGLSRGYYKQPLLTSDKFKHIQLDNVLSGKKYNVRVYKTEDLGRYMEDGNIEFLGRSNSLLVVNKLTSCIGIVETLISQYAGIKQNIILAMKNQDKHLICYYVAAFQLNTHSLIAFLSKKIPEYLIPKKFIKIDKVPLSRNGKLDRGPLLNYEIESGL